MTGAIPNIPLRNWRTQRHLSRAEMADRINASRAGVDERLACDEERIRRWESGEVRWPSPPYRRALKELTALEPTQLGFTTGSRTAQPPARIGAADAFRSEAELVDTLDLARMVTSSDLGQGTLDALQEAAELLCRAYPSASAGELRARTKQRLNYISRLLQGRLTLAQHRELLVTIGWLAPLLGCVHYDLGEREQAEAARQAAYQAGLQAGHGQIIAWSYEMAAWFALTEGRYHDVADYAQAGQQHAGLTNAMIQLVCSKPAARPGSASAVRYTPAWTMAPGCWNSCPSPSTRRTTSCSITPSGSSTPPPATPGSATTSPPKSMPAS